MSRIIISICLIALLVIIGIVSADDGPVKPADSIKPALAPEKAQEIKAVNEADDSGTVTKHTLVGTWVMVPNENILEAEYTFRGDGKYVKTEMAKDSVRFSVKGGYVFDNSVEPYRLNLCLNECGVPCSAWTTVNGILRFLTDNSLELKLSPDNDYPAAFDTIPDLSTLILNRKVIETKK